MYFDVPVAKSYCLLTFGISIRILVQVMVKEPISIQYLKMSLKMPQYRYYLYTLYGLSEFSILLFLYHKNKNNKTIYRILLVCSSKKKDLTSIKKLTFIFCLQLYI